MEKILVLLTIFILGSLTSVYAQSPEHLKVFVDGIEVDIASTTAPSLRSVVLGLEGPEPIVISLRDLAYHLNGTQAQFDITTALLRELHGDEWFDSYNRAIRTIDDIFWMDDLLRMRWLDASGVTENDFIVDIITGVEYSHSFNPRPYPIESEFIEIRQPLLLNSRERVVRGFFGIAGNPYISLTTLGEIAFNLGFTLYLDDAANTLRIYTDQPYTSEFGRQVAEEFIDQFSSDFDGSKFIEIFGIENITDHAPFVADGYGDVILDFQLINLRGNGVPEIIIQFLLGDWVFANILYIFTEEGYRPIEFLWGDISDEYVNMTDFIGLGVLRISEEGRILFNHSIILFDVVGYDETISHINVNYYFEVIIYDNNVDTKLVGVSMRSTSDWHGLYIDNDGQVTEFFRWDRRLFNETIFGEENWRQPINLTELQRSIRQSMVKSMHHKFSYSQLVDENQKDS